MTCGWPKAGGEPGCRPCSPPCITSGAKAHPLSPAAVRQIAISQAERCNRILFKERLEVIPDIPPERPGRLPSGTELEH